jgi:hypothetical protein
MISTCGQENSWIALLLASLFQKFVSLSLGKCGTQFSWPGRLDDQDEYKKLNINHSGGANISRCADLRSNSRSRFCQVSIPIGCYGAITNRWP